MAGRRAKLPPAMDAVGLLHNAARHYCTRHAAEWHERYADLTAAGRQRTTTQEGACDYTDEAYGILPRYQILVAIQHRDVEQFVPVDFRTPDEIRSMLVEAGETAQIPFKYQRPVSLRAVDDERGRFGAFARSTSEADQVQLPVLPFRRVLGEAEHRLLLQAFCVRWGQWYGGSVDPATNIAGTPEAGASTLHDQIMQEPGAYDYLRRPLATHRVTRLLELREWGDGYELDTPAASFTYTGAEGFWTSGDMAWMVYASHESSITFGGSWLVEGMRRVSPVSTTTSIVAEFGRVRLPASRGAVRTMPT